jgi:hypothetical protein
VQQRHQKQCAGGTEKAVHGSVETAPGRVAAPRGDDAQVRRLFNDVFRKNSVLRSRLR